MPALQYVIAQHFDTMLKHYQGAAEAWVDHVATLAKDACDQHNFVSVEGYLLLPALNAVQERLAGVAVVTTVEARNRQYFIAGSIEQILGTIDDT